MPDLASLPPPREVISLWAVPAAAAHRDEAAPQPAGPAPPQPAAASRSRRGSPGAELAQARRTARLRLPDPAPVAIRFTIALLEVEAGWRSAGQLERLCACELWVTLEGRIRRRGGPLPHRAAVHVVFCQEDEPGLADVVTVFVHNGRRLPVSMRLDASRGRWLVTELEYARHGGA